MGEFEEVYEMLKTVALDKKKRIKGVSSERADLLPSAFAVMHAFMKSLNFEDVLISSCGLREGIMFNSAVPLTIEKPIVDVANARQILWLQRTPQRTGRELVRSTF